MREKFLTYISSKDGKIMNASGTNYVAYLDTIHSTIHSSDCELLVSTTEEHTAKCCVSSAYELLQKSGTIMLPSQRTLRDYTYYTKAAVGFANDVDQQLKGAAKLLSCSEKDKSSCYLNASLMVRGLFTDLRFPYAQFPCIEVSGDQLFSLVWNAVSRLENMGFTVLALCCDGLAANHSLLRLHDVGSKIPYAQDGQELLGKSQANAMATQRCELTLLHRAMLEHLDAKQALSLTISTCANQTHLENIHMEQQLCDYLYICHAVGTVKKIAGEQDVPREIYKKWKRRWVVLSGNISPSKCCLNYCKKESDWLSKNQREIPKCQLSRDFTVQKFTGGGKHDNHLVISLHAYYICLAFESITNMDKWHRALERVLDRCTVLIHIKYIQQLGAWAQMTRRQGHVT
eukprot:Em0018g1011a